MLKYIIVSVLLYVIAGHTFTLSEEQSKSVDIVTTSSISVDLELGSSIGKASCILKPICYNNIRYYFESSIKRTRDEADLFCKAIGMKLVSVETCGENAFIADFIKDINCTNENFWTSGYLNANEKWMWKSTSKAFTYTNWRVGEPSFKTNGTYCVEYRNDYLQWNTQLCSRKRLSICESTTYCST